MGGTTRLDVNAPYQLLLLCGTGTTDCHGLVESQRALSYVHGWVVRQNDDPTRIPVLLHTGDLRYLTRDGCYTTQVGAT
jgi:hypothetical protein